ncbi:MULTISPECIES: helicase-exonuclease AddAB subunit AddA [Lactobacillus]|uniref:helicase-exonuclease AddAB subunit AddA n=1 Tax=Lactobacillus TaxID=1578 RepID=UPI00164F1F8C|nr:MULTISPECIES: helicase-exonuclease AddAB subunit AddA [Lactobacillus]MBC6360929.1 helicase-exonuclease AddAB subunit AddA [Lactobacillus apis]MBH9985425.1 helicase-exonuclease AddAB subunit AddA [Lactobacillus sp. M0390]
MPDYTNEQQQAIDDRDLDILVSASAGSGKTTVLVERLMQEILTGTGVNELLVVTFTKAAAQEMKAKIKSALEQRLNKHEKLKIDLREQLNLIDAANISTIDAFCLDVIHRFYYIIDLDPSFSVLTDETQAALMRERALQEIESEFLENDDQAFIAFYENFAGDRSAESARDLLLDLYNYAMAKPDYRDWLKSLPTQYEIGDDVTHSKLWQKNIKPYLLTTFSDLKEKLEQLLATAAMETKELAKVKDSFQLFDKCLQNYLASIERDENYDKQRELLRSCLFTSFRKSSKWDEDLLDFYEECVELKKDASEQVFTSFTSFYATDEKEQIALLNKGHQIMTAIVKAELALIERFDQLKRAENLVDYSDMEQFAYQILSQDTSNSQMARSFYQTKFKEILVDEYQDINSLQERILQLIKKDGQNNLFMVGDVKQSIYGFRQAEPSLFLHKYQEAAKDENKQDERILLSANFRSTKPVIKLVNQVFDHVLTTDFGGIDYQKEGQLVLGANYYPEKLPQASELIYSEKDGQDGSTNTEDEDEIDSAEIAMVINRIKQFKNENLQVYDTQTKEKRNFKYSDIAILTRSRSDNLAIMQEFAKNDIPLLVTDAKNYFQTLELTIVLNYLRIIDNPDQDIPLVAVLRSPLFNFTETDLAKIRVHSKNTGFYDALTSYVAVNDELSQKTKFFLNQLEELRHFAANHRISELIWSIYERTNLLEIMTALPNGKQRRVNLEALYERASSYESAGFKGLYQFINFIERMRRSQKDLAQPLVTKEAGDSVRLMTVHGSKGLEFPIVFYIGLQHRYQMRDLSGNYIINANNLGLTIRQEHYRADTLLKSYDNIAQKQQLLEEEARILYVGMTRARQKLILITEVKNYEKTRQKWQNQLNGQQKLPLSSKLSATSSMSFIGPAINFDKYPEIKISDITNSLDEETPFLLVHYENEKISSEIAKTEEVASDKDYALLTRIAPKLYDYDYPFRDASSTTAYQSVSEIKKAFNDPLETELENAHLLASTNRYLQPIETKPDFLFETKFTGAEIGTATHLLLQYYDYNQKGEPEQLELEIKDLIKQDKLNPEIVPSINQQQINWFVHSDFAKPFWQNPAQLKREVEFSSLLSASTLFNDFSDPNAKILIHGTIDGYFVEDDGIILFDYKTDHIDQHNLDLAIANIKQKYTGQLRLYERALNSFAEKPVKHKYLILLDAEKIVEIN